MKNKNAIFLFQLCEISDLFILYGNWEGPQSVFFV